MSEIRAFFSMAVAVLKGRYPMPWKTFLLTLLCLVYLISPLDLLPDMLPVLGIADDSVLLLLLLSMIRRDIKQYRDSLKPPKDNVIDAGDINDCKK